MRHLPGIIALFPVFSIALTACSGASSHANGKRSVEGTGGQVDDATQPSGGMTSGGTAQSGGSEGDGTGGVVEMAVGGSNSGGSATGDSGGSAAGGAPEGSGGAPEGVGGTVLGEPPVNYEYGFTPTTLTREDARDAYDAWKDIHLEDCGGGLHRVRWENSKLNATVSEGIGYGMLLTVAWGDREEFDGLYQYYQLAADSRTGLMNWLRHGCDASRSEEHNANPDGAAADADLDVAMALIMADCKWGEGNYAQEATRVISNIRQHMFADDNGRKLLLPGDSAWFHEMGGGCVNYSYFAPAYYREFAKYEQGEADFWNQAAEDTYSFLAPASHESTGLVRNWGSADGNDATADCHNAYNRAASYGDDAARTPWRVATDYLWNGNEAAKSWNDKVTTWVNGVGIENIVQWYYIDGNEDTEAGTWEDHTSINVGPFAVGAMTLDQASVDAFSSELVNIPAGESDHDGEYFPRMLRALSLLTLVGEFTTCGGTK